MKSVFVCQLRDATRTIGSLLAACFVAGILSATPAFAQTAADINSLIRTSRFAEALTAVDRALIQTPRDKQLRFQKGVILTELKQPKEAIVVFTKLTEDFPDQAEPYNNLAVLLSAAGRYDKARAALELAIRLQPGYAIAHENLGDVYAKLAAQSYQKALQLDAASAAAQGKLTALRVVTGKPADTVGTTTTVSPVTPTGATASTKSGIR